MDRNDRLKRINRAIPVWAVMLALLFGGIGGVLLPSPAETAPNWRAMVAAILILVSLTMSLLLLARGVLAFFKIGNYDNKK